MDASEIKSKRELLQRELKELFREFEEETGMTVTTVTVGRLSPMTDAESDYGVRRISTVTVDVKL